MDMAVKIKQCLLLLLVVGCCQLRAMDYLIQLSVSKRGMDFVRESVINQLRSILAVDKQFFINEQKLKTHRMILGLYARMTSSAYINAKNMNNHQIVIGWNEKRFATVDNEEANFVSCNKNDIRLIFASTPPVKRDDAAQNKKDFIMNECLFCLPYVRYLSCLPPKKRKKKSIANERLPLKKRDNIIAQISKKRKAIEEPLIVEPLIAEPLPNKIKRIKLMVKQDQIITGDIYIENKNSVPKVRTRRPTKQQENFIYDF